VKARYLVIIYEQLKKNTMGQISKGILGGFSGKVGTVIGGTWKGIEYMRSKSGKRSGNATQLQMEQRAKFAITTKFVHSMGDLLMVSFKKFAVQQTGINSAFAYVLANCITGVYPAYALDYTMALVSRGDLPNGTAPAAAAAGNGEIGFTWQDNTGTGKALGTDKAILVAYCPAQQKTIHSTGSAFRANGTGKLNVTEFAGETVETWVGFISANGRQVANSVHTGHVVVS
jgi:hypothetical protein